MDGMFLGTLVALHGILALGLGVLVNGDVVKAKSLRQFQIYFLALTLSWTVLYVNGPMPEVGWISSLGYLPFFLSYELLLSAVCLHAGHRPRNRLRIFIPVILISYVALLCCSPSMSLHVTDAYQILALSYCWSLCRTRYLRTENIGDKYLTDFMAIGVIAFAARSYCMYATDTEGSGFVYTAIVFTLVNIGICLSIMASYFISIKTTLEKQANTDSLTGVYNRRYFSASIEQTHAASKRRNAPYSVIICDIDHFKSINDTYGHTAGDVALTKVAQTLDEGKRIEDTLSRYGGEEFVFLLPDTGLVEAEQLAHRLRSKIENLTIDSDKKSFSLTMSFGVARIHDMLDSTDVVEHADAALLLAKGNGRNRICVSEHGVIRACNLHQENS